MGRCREIKLIDIANRKMKNSVVNLDEINITNLIIFVSVLFLWKVTEFFRYTCYLNKIFSVLNENIPPTHTIPHSVVTCST